MIVNHKSCGLVVFVNGPDSREYLLLHYPEGHWDFPKGHEEDSDSDRLATAVRELGEETGIMDAEIAKGFSTTISYSYKRKNKLHKKVVVYFLGEAKGKEVTLSHEHKGYIWLPYEDALKKVTFSQGQDTLIACEAFLKSL